ncbi:MAG TPA: glutamate synthase-related protein, partial [Solirubrobacteraceae bacterium]|nr:glutamate synthase-related protein [Solirubrobacteraceae bacterium]
MGTSRSFYTRAGVAALAGLVGYDLLQRHHAILRNFPIIGHLRYTLEAFGPELRQYIVTSNNEERPFSRDQRRWVYASSKAAPNVFGYGSDDEMEAVENLFIIKHSPFPIAAPGAGEPGGAPFYEVPAGKVMGGAHGRTHAFRPASIVNISGMSYGSLSRVAVEALNRGAKLAGCLQNTGEGGLADAHGHGGELVFQIGTGYFGCRDERGRFSLECLRERIEGTPVRAIEIKLSQGAKPGLGGLLPAVKVS